MKKIIISTGGTGGHVIPAIILYEHLSKKCDVIISTDIRGLKFLDKKYSELKDKLGNIGENKLLLITAVKVMDEYYETKKKVDWKKEELKILSNKFRELKSLIYEYK